MPSALYRRKLHRRPPAKRWNQQATAEKIDAALESTTHSYQHVVVADTDEDGASSLDLMLEEYDAPLNASTSPTRPPRPSWASTYARPRMPVPGVQGHLVPGRQPRHRDRTPAGIQSLGIGNVLGAFMGGPLARSGAGSPTRPCSCSREGHPGPAVARCPPHRLSTTRPASEMRTMTTSPLSVSDDPLDRQLARLTGGLNGWSTTAAPELGVDAVVMVDGPLRPGQSRPRRAGRVVAVAVRHRPGRDLGSTGRRRGGSADGRRGRRARGGRGAQDQRQHSADPVVRQSILMYSEDPWLSGVLAAAWSSELQQQGIGVCAERLVGNDAETERRFINAQIGPVTLREVYLRPFEMLVEAGVEMILMAYNRVNGTHSRERRPHRHRQERMELRRRVRLRLVGIIDTNASASAGLDLEMPGPARFFGERLVDAVDRGDVTAERLADMTQRLLHLAERAGRRDDVRTDQGDGARRS